MKISPRGEINPVRLELIARGVRARLLSQQADTEEARAAARAEFVRASRYSTARTQAESWVQYIDTIEATIEAQDRVERSQAIERARREIQRCRSILDVIELGGRAEVSGERLAECRDLIAKVEAGGTPEDFVDGTGPFADASDSSSGDEPSATGEDEAQEG